VNDVLKARLTHLAVLAATLLPLVMGVAGALGYSDGPAGK
jgi:hypothetical protein